MPNKPFTGYINEKYFDGMLSGAQIFHLENLDANNGETLQFAEGMFAQMNQIGIGAKDIPELIIWEIANILPKILPGAWEGIVPPITFANRHILVEEYMEKNRWKPLTKGCNIVDMGCGFPPLTAIDLANRFPDVNVTGADPSFGKYTVTDHENNYACILEDGSLKYLQPGNISSTQWNEIYNDLPATKKYFMDLFHKMLQFLPEQEDAQAFEEYQKDGVFIVRNPLRKYASQNLHFVQKGIGDHGFPDDLDMIRCMNVLLYFDPAFRETTLEWASQHLKEEGLFICGLNYSHSVNCRFSVYQKENGTMKFREFCFSIENLRPMEMVTYYSFRDDDFERVQILKHISILRGDPDFMKKFNIRFDLLLHQNQICSRTDDGYLGFIAPDQAPKQLQMNMHDCCKHLSKEFAEEAVFILKNKGIQAWVNEIGFVSVAGL